MSFKIESGRKFGLLTAIEQIENHRTKGQQWRCLCDCGSEKIAIGSRLVRGETKSCGCFRSGLAKTRGIKHGLSSHRLYKTWNSMMQRCHDPKAQAFPLYGGRGITVCEEWRDPAIFIADMSPGFREGLSLDRIDNDAGYSKQNCRWATVKTQNGNRRDAKRFTFNGETLSVSEWEERTGIPANCIHLRLSRLGWPIEKALTMESQRRHR